MFNHDARMASNRIYADHFRHYAPSSYQINLFDFVENGTGHAIVNARAGAAKSTSILAVMSLIPNNAKSIFLAFNKAIADELLAKNVNAMTLHKLGNQALYKTYHGKIDASKIDKIMWSIAELATKDLRGDDARAVYKKRNQIRALVSMCKNQLIDPNDSATIAQAAAHLGIEYDESVLGQFKNVFQKSIEHRYFFDFDDMIYLPVIQRLSLPLFDFIFVDESQDLNPAQIQLVLRVIAPNGRVICVGDPNQSIYGFRGADTNAMNNIKNALGATELPLSVCYRCPSSHLDMAREIVPEIENAPNCKEGIIEHINDDEYTAHVIKEKNQLTICRTNAPLVKYALQLIANGHKAVIRGRDLAANLITIITNLPDASYNSIHAQIDEWASKEIERLVKRGILYGAQHGLIDDKSEVLKTLADSCASRQCIIDKINALFDDKNGKDAIILSTIHKAKGLEADAVYILEPQLLPLMWKDQQYWEYQQEKNIEYVALTRAKEKMVFVNPSK